MYEANQPDRIDQGVLLRGVYFYAEDSTEYGLVLTPTCDVAQGKADLIHVCAAYRAEGVVEELLRSDWGRMNLADPGGNFLPREQIGAGKIRDLAQRIVEIQKQRFPRYHWLGAPDDVGYPLVLDFQNVTSMLERDLGVLNKVALLRSPYREQVSARYAAYMGRVGTPDTPAADLTASAEDIINRIFPLGNP